MSMFVKVKDNAIEPCRGTMLSAGYDLYSNEDGVINPKERKLIKTGIACAMKDNQYLSIVPRSGLAIKNGITVLNAPGTVDADYYPNEIGVILYNSSEFPFEIHKGDRIAQAILCEYKKMDVDHVKQTERNSGFGSTGV